MHFNNKNITNIDKTIPPIINNIETKYYPGDKCFSSANFLNLCYLTRTNHKLKK